MAKLMVLKGYENTALLTGGVLKFTARFRDFVDGQDVPIIELPKKSCLIRNEEICL